MDIPRHSGCASVGLDASNLQSDFERGVFRERLEEDVDRAVAVHVDRTNQSEPSRCLHRQDPGRPLSLESGRLIPIPEEHVASARIAEDSCSVQGTVSSQRSCVFSGGEGSCWRSLTRDVDGPDIALGGGGEATDRGGGQ